MPLERLQKVIARAGVASRRTAEELIVRGKVRVNGVVVRELGSKADPRRDRIEVDGRRIVRERPVYVLLHKPVRTVTTARDPEGRPTVVGLLRDVAARVFSVGRLDYDTSGALLLTNDGELAQVLAHPSSRVPRVYRVKVGGRISTEALDRLRAGVVLEDGPARAEDVFVVAATERTTSVQLTLREGRNRQIHRMMEAVGSRVRRLARVSFAGLAVDDLRPGAYRTLRDREVARLRRDYRRPTRARGRLSG